MSRIGRGGLWLYYGPHLYYAYAYNVAYICIRHTATCIAHNCGKNSWMRTAAAVAIHAACSEPEHEAVHPPHDRQAFRGHGLHRHRGTGTLAQPQRVCELGQIKRAAW